MAKDAGCQDGISPPKLATRSLAKPLVPVELSVSGRESDATNIARRRSSPPELGAWGHFGTGKKPGRGILGLCIRALICKKGRSGHPPDRTDGIVVSPIIPRSPQLYPQVSCRIAGSVFEIAVGQLGGWQAGRQRAIDDRGVPYASHEGVRGRGQASGNVSR
jgi:hypothetical protein